MGRILRTNRATEDLVEIFTDAARRSPQLLARRRGAFEKTLSLLADNPGLGSRRLPSHLEVRVFPVERFLVFYRPLAGGDGIDVPRVRPAASDWLDALEVGEGTIAGTPELAIRSDSEGIALEARASVDLSDLQSVARGALENRRPCRCSPRRTSISGLEGHGQPDDHPTEHIADEIERRAALSFGRRQRHAPPKAAARKRAPGCRRSVASAATIRCTAPSMASVSPRAHPDS
jgi:plasmid stabilization system protein ParE